MSFRALFLSVAAMSAEPAPNKQFYSLRPDRKRAAATAPVRGQGSSEFGRLDDDVGEGAASGTYPVVLLPCAAKSALKQAMHESATDGGRQIPCLA